MSRPLPRLIAAKTDASATVAFGRKEQSLNLGQSLGPWVLRAAWTEGGCAFAAIESAEEICILAGERPHLWARISRPFGELANLAAQPMPRFEPGYYRELLAAKPDLLARRVLKQGEPSFAAVADLLPPVLDMTFLGDGRAVERPIVRADGTIEGHFEAAFEFDATKPQTHYRHGLLAGGMNAICYARYDEGTASGVELIAFALADDASGKLAAYRRVRAAGEPRHQRSCEGVQEITWQFYAALLRAYERDQAFLAAGAQFSVPEPPVQEGVLASLLLGDLTFRGVLSRYGVGQYDREDAHSFPPPTIYLAWACMEWGRLERARDVLSYYLNHTVKDDGTFAYYGPAVAEYGQMLAMAARYVQLSGDRTWWDDHLVIIRRIAARLLALREESKRRNAGDVKHCGLIPGLPEADYHADEKEWGKYYFAGDVWVCRGLREVGRVMVGEAASLSPPRTGRGRRPVPPGVAEGERLIAEADAYERYIRAAVRASLEPGSRFVPAGPDEPPAFERLTESTHASYCNYRYLLEMVSAGILDKPTVRKIAAYRRAHGGELLGMTRFEPHLDDWPTWHYARGLLDVDDVAGYLMTFYGHLAHHQSRGNWASYEQVEVDPCEKGARGVAWGAEQVLPCQVMAPIMLKHMLVDEERDAEVLHLLRACPGAWLASAEGVAAEGVPTRWGPVSLRTRCEGGTLTVELDLEFGERRPEELRVRLAMPGTGIKSVTLNGKRHALFAAKSGTVTIKRPAAGPSTLKATVCCG